MAAAATIAMVKKKRASPRRNRARRRPFVIDFHAHVVDPEVAVFSRGHVVNTAGPDLTGVSEQVKAAWKKWRQSVDLKMVDPKVRLRDMDKMGGRIVKSAGIQPE